MKIVKVKVLNQYKLLETILDKDDVVDLEIITLDKKVVVTYKKVKKVETINGKEVTSYTEVEDLVRNPGEYVGFRFKSKNGLTYDDINLRNIIGYFDIKDLFEKI